MVEFNNPEIEPISKFGLEKKFLLDTREKNFLISSLGHFSSVLKVKDENGKIYTGKFPLFVGNLGEVLTFNFNFSQDYLNKVILSRKHENFIANEIYENVFVENLEGKKYSPTFKPEGVYNVYMNQTKNYLPAFVNEFDQTFLPLNEISSKERDALFGFQQQIVSKLELEGFTSDCYDLLIDSNWLYSEKKGELKIIDFGWWKYKNHFNSFPTLSEEFFREDYFEDKN